MNAKKCDRCGTLYERFEKESSYTVSRITVAGYRRACDLCEDCSKQLYNWMKGLSNGKD